jgi:hypothetical protein
MGKLILSFAAAAALLAIPSSRLFSTELEYKVKAAFMQKFTDFVEWPESAINSSPHFVIGIIGNSPIGSYLAKNIGDKKIYGKSVEIKHLTDYTDIRKCHVLFISFSEKESLSAILANARNRPVLTVGDTAKFSEMGVMINFYREGDYIRFEVNIDEAFDSKLKFSSRLLKLSKIVGGKGSK